LILKNGELGYLSAFKRHERPMCVKPIPSGKLAPGSKQADRKTKWQHVKGLTCQIECDTATYLNGRNASWESQESSILRRKRNEDILRLGGGECHGSRFQRFVEYPKIF